MKIATQAKFITAAVSTKWENSPGAGPPPAPLPDTPRCRGRPRPRRCVKRPLDFTAAHVSLSAALSASELYLTLQSQQGTSVTRVSQARAGGRQPRALSPLGGVGPRRHWALDFPSWGGQRLTPSSCPTGRSSVAAAACKLLSPSLLSLCPSFFNFMIVVRGFVFCFCFSQIVYYPFPTISYSTHFLFFFF